MKDATEHSQEKSRTTGMKVSSVYLDVRTILLTRNKAGLPATRILSPSSMTSLLVDILLHQNRGMLSDAFPLPIRFGNIQRPTQISFFVWEVVVPGHRDNRCRQSKVNENEKSIGTAGSVQCLDYPPPQGASSALCVEGRQESWAQRIESLLSPISYRYYVTYSRLSKSTVFL